MTLEETIIQYVHDLPRSKKAEVLDFVEYLKSRIEKKERQAWAEFSLSSAMSGMEDEETPYSLDDLKESFS